MEERIIRRKPRTRTVSVQFNGEHLKAFYLVIDARTPAEKWHDKARGSLSGPVIVYFQGHSQRPEALWPFTTELARLSRSGIVVIPVSDTPYGTDPSWRGDAGKTALLMEVARYALKRHGIDFTGYESPYPEPIIVDRREMGPRYRVKNAIQATSVSFGWSHGCSLARRFASTYPTLVTDLVQLCPSGYTPWGDQRFTGPARLLSRFMIECGNISLRGATHPHKCFGSGWQIVKGNVGDSFRSVGSLRGGNKHLMKPFRNLRDLKECAWLLDHRNTPLAHLEHISVIFARNDSLFDFFEIMGRRRKQGLEPSFIHAFWSRFFGDVDPRRTTLTLRMLPGDHIAPYVHNRLYPEVALRSIRQHRADPVAAPSAQHRGVRVKGRMTKSA